MNENLLREWIRKVLLEATDEEREEIERAMADYQARGGKVQKLSDDPELPDKPSEWIPGDFETKTLGRRASDEDAAADDLGACATNPLFTGTFLGYAGEWAVFHAAQGASQPSGTPWGDSRLEKPWKKSSPACRRDFVNAYQEMYDLIAAELKKIPDHGDVTIPPQGNLPAGSQSSTAPVDVPLENINIHVKYNQTDKDRLQGFQKEKSKMVGKGKAKTRQVTTPGSPSTAAYYEALSAYTAPYVQKGGDQELQSLKTLNRLFPDVRVLDNYNNPKRPSRLSGYADLTKARTNLKKINKKNADGQNPDGVLIIDEEVATELGVPSWDGRSNPWWASVEGKQGREAVLSQIPDHRMDELDPSQKQDPLAALAQHDALDQIFKAFLKERAQLMKGSSDDPDKGSRSKFLKALEDGNYPDLLLKDIYEQHFDLPMHTDEEGNLTGARRDTSLKPSYYAKFFSSPPSRPGSSPHKLKFTGGASIDTVPILKVVPDTGGDTTNFYRIVGIGPDEEFPLTGKRIASADPDLAGKEALTIQFNLSGQTKVPQLLGGANFSEFSRKVDMPPINVPLGGDIAASPEGPQNTPINLASAYVRELITLLYA